MILEVVIFAFSWHFFKWLFRILLVAGIGSKISSTKDSLLEQVKEMKGAKKKDDTNTSADW